MQYQTVKITAAKEIMYHGTTSNNLRSILKKGLVYEGSGKIWDETKSESLESYPGIYFSSSVMKADRAAGDAIRKYGGEKLIVIAQIETQTPEAVIDEDGLEVTLKGTIPFHHEVVVLEQALNPHQVDFDKSWEKFKRRLEQEIDPIPKKIDVLRERFEDLIVKFLKYQVFQLIEKGLLSKETLSPNKKKVEKFTEKYDFDEVRDEYRKTLDSFLRKMNFMASGMVEGPLGKSIRMINPVNFKGANKILAIGKIVPKEGSKHSEDFKVIYNKSDKALEKFVEEARERISEKLELIE